LSPEGSVAENFKASRRGPVGDPLSKRGLKGLTIVHDGNEGAFYRRDRPKCGRQLGGGGKKELDVLKNNLIDWKKEGRNYS